MTWRIPLTCEHDGDAGILRDGRPRCPMCRRQSQRPRDSGQRPAVTDGASSGRPWSPTAIVEQLDLGPVED